MNVPRERAVIVPASIPRLAPGVRFRFDQTRGQWVLLAPERMFEPDEIAVAILEQLDGVATVDAVVDVLAARYQAPRAVIAGDVIAMLQDLADKGCVAA
jgi:pyrroloquinoline quinone biosynthesis protein D